MQHGPAKGARRIALGGALLALIVARAVTPASTQNCEPALAELRSGERPLVVGGVADFGPFNVVAKDGRLRKWIGGVGKLDSNGGSDFDTNEVADTSDTNGPCNLPHPGCRFGADAALRAEVTVGNGTADTCSSGTINLLITVPVHIKTWSDKSSGTFDGCPGDGVFNGDDTVVAEFDQIIDFTTATGAGKWMDLDGDGCTLSGLGPPEGYAVTGTCIDRTKVNTTEVSGTLVAAGEFASTGGTFDGSFSTTLPNTLSGPAAPIGAACTTAPMINYSGTATRCIPYSAAARWEKLRRLSLRAAVALSERRLIAEAFALTPQVRGSDELGRGERTIVLIARGARIVGERLHAGGHTGCGCCRTEAEPLLDPLAVI